jgi:hypothetical protein
MRWVLTMAIVLAGCGPGDPPSGCDCILSGPPGIDDPCCGYDPCWVENGKWVHAFCDPPPPLDAGDAGPPPPDPCDMCTADQMCVQLFTDCDHVTTSCVPRVVECPFAVCSQPCKAAYCPAPYECANRDACEQTNSDNLFTCYLP